MHHFCTYFDYFYLPRGLALYRSLKRHCPSFTLWVLCLDHPSYQALAQLQESAIRLIALEEFERGDQELVIAKQNRTLIEYYFTCTPSLPLFIFGLCPEIDHITYLDADLMFFSNPDPIFAEIGENSIGIIGHRFPPHLQRLDKHGVYNVGWITFRRDDNALSCLNWWRDKCIEWCYDRVEDGRFADQKYLDDWPRRFKNVVVIEHKGANLAPWNLANYKLHERQREVWVDDQPLIFFHFHGFSQVNSWLYNPGLASYGAKLSGVVRHKVYAAYIRTLSDVIQQIFPFIDGPCVGTGIRESTVEVGVPQNRSVSGSLMKSVGRKLHISWEILARRYLIAR